MLVHGVFLLYEQKCLCWWNLTYLKKHINHKKSLMVCGHNIPTVVSNYGQSQNNQAMQTTIRNATVMTVFLLKMGNRDNCLTVSSINNKAVTYSTLKEWLYYASWQWPIFQKHCMQSARVVGLEQIIRNWSSWKQRKWSFPIYRVFSCRPAWRRGLHLWPFGALSSVISQTFLLISLPVLSDLIIQRSVSLPCFTTIMK